MKTYQTMCFVLAALTGSSQAHQLPLNTIHPGKAVGVAASFDLSGADIERTYSSDGRYFNFDDWTEDNAPNDSTSDRAEDPCIQISHARTCGQVDDFFRAATVGMLTCNAFQVLHTAQYPGKLVPRFTRPASFVAANQAAAGHHSDYSTSEGIAFDCVYPLEVAPVERHALERSAM